MSVMDVQLVALTALLICLLCVNVGADFDENVPLQRFDGWYNNPLNPSWGGVGQPLERNITPCYEDETYRPSGRDRPNPRRITNEIFGANAGRSGIANQRNLTALFAFFGQIVQRELLDTHEVTCPVEILDTRVPAGDPDFDRETTGEKSIPYERSAYDKNSGQSPNNPRRQVNQASSYIDASFLYGSSMVRSEFLREPNSGKLACHDQWGYFPLKNDVKLAFHSYAYKHKKSHELWRLGDPQAFENPAVLAMNLLFYRYHNVKALEVMERNVNLSADEVFDYARRSVIATLQKIIVYDWLPNLIGMELPPYTGYKPSVKSDVTDIFDAGPINYIMTMIPPAIYQLGSSCTLRPRKNDHRAMRLCNTYWKAMEYLLEKERGTEEILRGLSVQLAELEDTYVISDLRNKFYGPLYHSNLDLVLLTIMKGRDYGLPDYNVVRHTMGLEKKKTIQDINPELTRTRPQLIQKVVEVYKDDVGQLDMFVGGMLETSPEGPGELFTTILYDQFLRLRDGDRFWFENKDNNLFTDEEVENIKNTTFGTIMAAITRETEKEKIPHDVFKVSEDSHCGESMLFTEEELEPCPENEGYDFFAGSEIPYVIIWTCLGFLPLLCILVAYLLAKCKKFRLQRALKKHRADKEKKRHLRRTMSNSISVHDATEWRGTEPGRQVELHLTTPGNLEVFTTSGSQVRSIKIGSMSNLTVHISSNKKRVAMNFIIPKEYDLVVEFPSEAIRNEFERLLCEFATSHNVNIVVMELKLQDLLAAATTKEKRNKILEKFFKTVFSEAFDMDYQPSLDSGQTDVKSHSQDILEVELSKEEFAEAMAVKSNSGFVEHFFSIIDSDRNGYISFREFLNAVVLFSKGSIQEKLQTMFYMYDIDGSGFMTKKQMGQMFISLLELAQGDLGQDNVDMLVDSLCQQVGMELRDKFSFKDFCHIFAPQMDKLWNASFDWKGLNKVMPSVPKISKPTPNTSEADLTRRRGSMGSAVEKVSTASSGGAGAGSGMDPGVTKVVKNFEAVRERYTPVKAKIKLVKHFIENYRQHIFFLILFFGICVGLFAERFYYYTVEQEHAGFRKLMSYGISITRGAAASMSFTFSFLLLTMCRNTITYLRSTALNQFVPFDSHVSFHKIVAWTALLFSAIHIVGYSFNFYHLVTQPTRLLCIFTSLVFSPEQRFTFQEWLFGTMTGFTGVLLVLVLCIIYVFATQTARRHIFSLFWLTHKLFIALYVLAIIHGASVVVQKPMFFVYLTGPAILFTADKVISLSRKKTELCIIKALNLPSDVTMIEFKRPPRFEYKSGQWVRIACLAQGKDEYHPFTLTSAPHEDTLKVHIRALGPWTWNLRHTFDDDSVKDARSYPKLYLDGPYGAGQQDWYQYDVSVLVGAGIGVTPYASILKDFVHMASINMRYKVKCQKLYFIWITGSQRHFEWLIEILREVEEIDTEGMVAIDIFITQFFQNFDLRTSLLYIFEEHFQKMNGGKSVFTGLKATTHFGRPQLNKIMAAVHRTHPQARKVGVFSCGPPGVTKGVERACVDASKETKAMFEHHFENF